MDPRDETERPPRVGPAGPPGHGKRRRAYVHVAARRSEGEAIEARATHILLWARVLAAILVIAPLGLLSCVGLLLGWGLPEDRGQPGLTTDPESRALVTQLLMVPAGIIVASLFAVIAGGGRGWLAIAACSVGGLVIGAFGLLGLILVTDTWVGFHLYFVAILAVGGALIVGAYLRLRPLLHARGTGRS